MKFFRVRDIVLIYGLIFVLIIMAYSAPRLYESLQDGCYHITPDQFSSPYGNLEHRLRDRDEPIIMTYSTTVSDDVLCKLSQDELYLVVSRLEGQGYTARWNGQVIGTAGDPVNGRANVWNSVFMFPIDRSMIQVENTLELTVHQLYDMGASYYSIQIATREAAHRIVNIHESFSSHMTTLTLGMVLLTGIIVYVAFIVNKRRERDVSAILLSLILLSIHSLEYMRLDQLPIDYLLYKKIVQTGLVLAFFMMSRAISISMRKRYICWIGIGLTAAYLVGAVLIRDMLTYKKFYNIAIILMPLNAVLWGSVIMTQLKRSEKARIYFGGMLMFGIIGCMEAVALIWMPDTLAKSHIATVLVMVTMLILFNVRDMMLRNDRLKREMDNNAQLYNQSIRDHLTGAYNRNYCTEILEDLETPFSVVMMDIDKFKKINDTYGHLAGDEALKNVVQCASRVLRKSDIVGRYAGDEFIMIMDCDQQTAEKVCQRLRREVADTPLPDGEHAIRMTVSIGIYGVQEKEPVDVLIKYADKALYQAKNAGRNAVCVYSEGYSTDETAIS